MASARLSNRVAEESLGKAERMAPSFGARFAA